MADATMTMREGVDYTYDGTMVRDAIQRELARMIAEGRARREALARQRLREAGERVRAEGEGAAHMYREGAESMRVASDVHTVGDDDDSRGAMGAMAVGEDGGGSGDVMPTPRAARPASILWADAGRDEVQTWLDLTRPLKSVLR